MNVIFSKSAIAILTILSIGFVLRIFFTPFELPSRSSDAFFFLIHALSFPNSLDYIGGTYFMWSGLLAIIFIPFQFENYEGYFTIIRITSILISTISGLFVYLIAKEIMNRKYALFAMALFIIEPNIIENAIFGLTEPLFILLGMISLYFLVQKNSKLLPLAFVFAALAADTRATGLLLLPVSIFVVYFRSVSRKEVLKWSIIGVALFGILYMPMIINEQTFPNSGLLDPTPKEESFSVEQNKFSENKFIAAGITEITHIFRILLPYMIFFTPIGILISLKNFNWKIKTMILIIIFQFIIAIPQYTVSVEFRNLFFLIPIFSLFGALSIEYFTNNKKLTNIILSCLVFALILSSYYFLQERQPDSDLIIEKERFGKFVASELEGVVATASDWAFIEHNVKLSTDSIQRENPFRPLEGEIKLITPNFIIDNNDEMVDYLSENEVSYLIVDDKKSKRFKMSQDIYYNAEKFDYLTKVFDSDDHDYKQYRTKIFMIDHEKIK